MSGGPTSRIPVRVVTTAEVVVWEEGGWFFARVGDATLRNPTYRSAQKQDAVAAAIEGAGMRRVLE